MRMLLTVALVAVLSISSALAAERLGGPRLRPQRFTQRPGPQGRRGALGDVSRARRPHRSQQPHRLRRRQPGHEVDPVGRIDVDDARRGLSLRARHDQHRSDVRSDDRLGRSRAAARGGSDRGRIGHRRTLAGRVVQAHRPAEPRCRSVRLGNTRRTAHRHTSPPRTGRRSRDGDDANQRQPIVTVEFVHPVTNRPRSL